MKVVEVEPNYHGIHKSWHALQNFLVRVVRPKHPHIKSQDAAYKLAADYTNCWNILGYNYEKLKEKTAEYDLKIKQKKIASDTLNKELWTKLNNNRMHLANNLSLSFLVDRSLEHFRQVLKNEPRKSEKRRLSKKYDSDSDDIIIESPDISSSSSKVSSEMEIKHVIIFFFSK